MIKVIYLFNAAGVISKSECKKVLEEVKDLNSAGVKKRLLKHYKNFENTLKSKVTDEFAADYLIQEIDTSLDLITKQLSLFDEEENQ